MDPDSIDRIRKAAEDEDFMRRLLTDPKKAAAELGIELSDEAVESLKAAAGNLIRHSKLPEDFEVKDIRIIWHRNKP